MMKEISLHVLDIIENSIAAGATLIEVEAEVVHAEDRLRVSVRDNGRGMEEALLRRVTDPFVTSRTTRRVGLGIPMFKAGAEAAGGSFRLESKPGEGTYIEARYRISHWDRPPLGDMAQTMYAVVMSNEEIAFTYLYTVDGKSFRFDTREIRQTLGEIPLHTPAVSAWVKDYLLEGIEALYGGV